MPTMTHETTLCHPAHLSLASIDQISRTWLDELKKCGLSLELKVCLPVGEKTSAATWEEIKELSRHVLVEIQSPKGGDRLGLARDVHQVNAKRESVFLALVGEALATEKTIADIATAIRALANSPDSELLRESIMTSTFFVDDYHLLSDLARQSLKSIVDLGQQGCAVPRVVVGIAKDAESGMPEAKRHVLPPLTSRPEEVQRFLLRHLEGRRNSPQLTSQAMDVLRNWQWTGDYVELDVFIRRLLIDYRGQMVDADTARGMLETSPKGSSVGLSLADVERDHIYRVLESYSWNRTRSAKSLGIDVKTLYNKLKRYETARKCSVKHD